MNQIVHFINSGVYRLTKLLCHFCTGCLTLFLILQIREFWRLVHTYLMKLLLPHPCQLIMSFYYWESLVVKSWLGICKSRMIAPSSETNFAGIFSWCVIPALWCIWICMGQHGTHTDACMTPLHLSLHHIHLILRDFFYCVIMLLFICLDYFKVIVVVPHEWCLPSL